MSAEPDIAVLEQESNSGSDDLPLSVQRKSKGKKKAVATPREPREKSRERSEDEGAGESEVITCTVKVKKGKRNVAVELTGPKNEYDSQLWHDRNDLFVINAPTTSTGSNKIVTHAYPYDENHPRFSNTWKRRIALSSLPARTVFTRGKASPFFLQFPFICFKLILRSSFPRRGASVASWPITSAFARVTGTKLQPLRAPTAAPITRPASCHPSSLIGI
jgi:hypothetical protein